MPHFVRAGSEWALILMSFPLLSVEWVAFHILFNLGRHLVGAEHYRNLRIIAFKDWKVPVA